ncbi:hypothetical protein [Inquilinus limosus]|uniref:hypothetical protein n=1 Tax=Inquilinus limosus TaxID=171674 RepID=UPI0015C5BC39|nr:hypothetical protein [Inquilinus limosus]
MAATTSILPIFPIARDPENATRSDATAAFVLEGASVGTHGRVSAASGRFFILRE